jgi:hypothetical protein
LIKVITKSRNSKIRILIYGYEHSRSTGKARLFRGSGSILPGLTGKSRW